MSVVGPLPPPSLTSCFVRNCTTIHSLSPFEFTARTRASYAVSGCAVRAGVDPLAGIRTPRKGAGRRKKGDSAASVGCGCGLGWVGGVQLLQSAHCTAPLYPHRAAVPYSAAPHHTILHSIHLFTQRSVVTISHYPAATAGISMIELWGANVPHSLSTLIAHPSFDRWQRNTAHSCPAEANACP